VIHDASSAVLAIECKYQDTLGTVDEKIPYAIQDMQAMGVPVCLAYAGSGFSSGILHMLAACPIAAQCLPPADLRPSRETRELDIALAMAFKFWDLVVAHKKPFTLPPEAPIVAAAPVATAAPVVAAAPVVTAAPVGPAAVVAAPVVEVTAPAPPPSSGDASELRSSGPLFAASRLGSVD